MTSCPTNPTWLRLFKRFLAAIRAEGAPLDIEHLLADNGTEFIGREFIALLSNHGIRHELTHRCQHPEDEQGGSRNSD